jgi:hypothetical protein
LVQVHLDGGGGRLWSLWAKTGAVGNVRSALSTASRSVREAHRPQMHSLAGAEGAGPSSVATTTRGRG